MSGRDSGISQGTRLKLLAIGIPERDHTREGLIKNFPAEFHMQTADLETDVLGRVLAHLVEAGIIELKLASGHAPGR